MGFFEDLGAGLTSGLDTITGAIGDVVSFGGGVITAAVREVGQRGIPATLQSIRDIRGIFDEPVQTAGVSTGVDPRLAQIIANELAQRQLTAVATPSISGGGRTVAAFLPTALPGGASLVGAAGRAIGALGTAGGINELLGLFGGDPSAGELIAAGGDPFFRASMSGVRARRTITRLRPDGSVSVWRHMGRPILFSGDIATCKRVARVARRARRGRL